MEPAEIIARLKASRIPHREIAEVMGRDRVAATNMLLGKRAMKVDEIGPLTELLARADGNSAMLCAEQNRYVPVEVLPTYAGMGGGGNGDGELDTALVPRALVEDVLRGKPRDFLLVNARGDSMEPKFFQGDQILVDRRDCSPVQPGPFALRVEDSYVLKNVERTREGLRVFSANHEYSSEYVDPEQIEIIGRPVWVGRLL